MTIAAQLANCPIEYRGAQCMKPMETATAERELWSQGRQIAYDVPYPWRGSTIELAHVACRLEDVLADSKNDDPMPRLRHPMLFGVNKKVVCRRLL